MHSVTTKTLIVGFIPLLDCASLVIAVEKGFAANEGLNVALVRETSWANIRDRVVVGHFDAAHMLGPMPLASSLGIGHLKVPLIAPYSLNLGGNAITVTNELWQQMCKHGAFAGAEPSVQCAALAQVIADRATQGLPLLTFGMVYPFSNHNYELRYWLAVGGIDPDRDVRLVVIPPSLSVDALRSGNVDGYCVGEPWNSVAVAAGVGSIATTTTAIWNLSPEKVLGCRADWAQRNHERLAALLRSLYRASWWCDQVENHAELASILSEQRYIGVSAELLRLGLSGQLIFEPGGSPLPVKNFLSFARHDATFPWVSHAAWYYSQMVRWNQCTASEALFKAACATYRPDVHRQALQTMRVSLPTHDLKIESALQGSGFFDQREFDTANIAEYIAGFNVSNSEQQTFGIHV